MESSSSSDKSMSGKGVHRKRSKSIVATVRSFFGRQLSIPPLEEATVVQEESDSSAKITHQDSSKQEEAWIQACYNAITLLFLFLTGCIVLAVYYILEPFLHPLLWAVLVGMVLHPFKHMSTSGITQWLQNVRRSGVPLSLVAVFTPLFLFNWLSSNLEKLAIQSWRVVGGLALTVLAVLLMYLVNISVFLYKLLDVVLRVFAAMETLLAVPLYVMLITLTLGFLLLLLLSRGRYRYSLSLKILSSTLWFMVILNLSFYILGSASVPLVITLFSVAVVLSFTWKKQPQRKKRLEVVEGEGIYLKALSSVTSLYEEGEKLSEETQIDIEKRKASLSPQESKTKVKVQEEADEPDTASSVSFGKVETIPDVPFKKDQQVGTGGGAGAGGEKGDGVSPRRNVRRMAPQAHLKAVKARENSNHVFMVLFAAYFGVIFWRYPLFLILLSPLVCWSGLKYLVSLNSTLGTRIRHLLGRVLSVIRGRAWLVFPPPLPTLMRMFLYGDGMILNLAVRSMGSLVSSFIILGLVVGVVVAVVMLLLEVQAELAHYMSVGVKAWNSTLISNPHLSQWMHNPETNQTLDFSFESLAKQSFQYGRVWLAQKIHSLVGHSADGGPSLVEKQIMTLFDQLYHSYFQKEDYFYSLGPTKESIMRTPSAGALFAEVKDLVMNNLGTVLSVLKSLGSIITENFSVALSFLYALLQLVFSGGTALFNFVVFVSSLFYLLSWSEEQYLPVQWVMDLLPHLSPPTSGPAEEDETAKEQGEAFQRAIRSVFIASFRRAFFYSLYTWLSHTILAMPVSILPAVLAGIAGAIPFVSPYWVSLPAILELWLLENSPLAAVALLVLALVPVLFVDTLINGEIEGGHPYLTGLAILGGIYFAGLEGALIGPILLCCLLFFMDVYGVMFSSPASS